jgi:hypothetical protein
MCEVIDRYVCFTQPNADPTAGVPSSRQIRIEQKSAIDEGGGGVQIPGDECECMSTPRESDRIILT